MLLKQENTASKQVDSSSEIRSWPGYACIDIQLAEGHMYTSLSVCLCSPPMGWPRSSFAHGLHRPTNGLRDSPDFQRIPTTNHKSANSRLSALVSTSRTA